MTPDEHAALLAMVDQSQLLFSQRVQLRQAIDALAGAEERMAFLEALVTALQAQLTQLATENTP